MTLDVRASLLLLRMHVDACRIPSAEAERDIHPLALQSFTRSWQAAKRLDAAADPLPNERHRGLRRLAIFALLLDETVEALDALDASEREREKTSGNDVCRAPDERAP